MGRCAACLGTGALKVAERVEHDPAGGDQRDGYGKALIFAHDESSLVGRIGSCARLRTDRKRHGVKTEILARSS